MADILVVDDEQSVRTFLKTVLSDAGHIVREAGDAAEILRMYDERRADLIIVDLLIPGKGGLEIIIEIRSRRIPVKIIAISGASENVLKTAQRIGADHILRKPFTEEALLTVINSALEAL